MHVDFEHLAALEYFCADLPADLRRLHRKVLVGSLRFDLEGLDAALVDGLQHVLDCSLADGFHGALALHRRADGRYAEHLGDLMDDRLLVRVLPSARTKIRPSWRFTLTPSNFFKSFLIRSTSIRSKYGLFMPFRATSPHLTIKICSFFAIHTSIFSLIFYSASFALRIPAIPAKSALRLFLQSTLRGYRKLPSLRKRFTAAVDFVH